MGGLQVKGQKMVMRSEGHSLALSPQGRGLEKSDYPRPNIRHRLRAVLNMHLAGYTADEIADALGYAGRQSVYQALQNKQVQGLMQETMDYYDERFKILYPKVIEAVASGLDSLDEKVQLEASKIWLKSHGRHQPQSDGDQGPKVSVENLVANILVNYKGDNGDSRSSSDRDIVQDTKQRKTDRRFYTESEPKKIRRTAHE